MTTYSKSSLKTFFESGDVPQGGDFANLIDSYINVVETTAQSMAGTLITPELTTAYISATNIRVTGTLSANNLAINGILLSAGAITGVSLGVSHDVSAGGYVTGSAATFTTSISAASLNLTGNASAANIFASAVYITDRAIVSAAGTTQGTAATLTPTICRLQGINDGSATGFILTSNMAGKTQYLINQTAISGNVYPCVGGNINGGSTNAPFAIAGNTLYTVIHILSSAYAIK